MTGYNEHKGAAQILVVEDDPIQRRLLKNAIERHGHVVHQAENGRIGLEMVKRGSGLYNVIVLDLMMPEMTGLEFLEALHEFGTHVPVIVQTGQGGIETVVQAMRAGAFDFVVKPVSPERINTSISNALKLDQREVKARAGRRSRSGAVGFDDIVSASPAMIRVIDLAQRASQSTIPVVLEGESGVGKELVARAIQSGSDRSGKPFVTVNCGAIPHNLVESILFGHEKGAFTGATERHLGKFVEANGGTLFLDEVGELPLDAQVKLLRAIQEGEVDPVGGKKSVRVDIRLISATNKSLLEQVKRGEFREDLYYRLNVFPITLPPLRQRREDIADLARGFLARFAAEEGRKLSGLTREAAALISSYDWPGNVRQLENAVFRAVVLADGDELDVTEFPQIAALVDGFDVRIPAAPVLPPKPIHTGPAMVTGQPLREIVTIRDPHTLPLLDAKGDVRSMTVMET